MDQGEEDVWDHHQRQRETTYGLSSEEYSRIDQIVQPLLAQSPLSLQSLLQALESNILIRSEPELIQTIFKNPQMVETLIQFPLQPRKFMKKYSLSLKEGRKVVSLVVSLLKDNQYFYEEFFLMMETNSQLVEKESRQFDQVLLTRTSLDQSFRGLQMWFQFLWEEQDGEEKRASLGYFAELFLPLIRFCYNESSRICQLYEERYGKVGEVNIWLITHFSPQLIDKVIRFSYHEEIFEAIFTIVRVSLDEQQWQDSLALLSKLCQSAIEGGATSDKHVGHLCCMVKEIKDNVSKDKNNTVFAFLEAIIQSRLVSAALQRLELLKDGSSASDEDVIELNMQLLDEIVHTYYVLLETGVKRTTQKMEELREELILIKQKIPSLLKVIKSFPAQSLNFSNGQSLKRTPLFVFHFLQMIQHLLTYLRERGYQDKELMLEEEYRGLLELVKTVLAQNRWNSILHSIIQQVVGLMITTETFKAKNTGLSSFLEFLVEAFASKKYVFLNSTRIIDQGDLRLLYNLCCKITKSFEGACKNFGLNNEYEAWEHFIVNVLKNYQWRPEKTKFLPQGDLFESADLNQSEESQERRERLTGYIDEADEKAEIKRSIDKIDTFQKWKNRNSKKTQMHRSGSLLPLSDLRKGATQPRQSDKSPINIGRNRGSVPVTRKMNKSDIFIRNLKKQSSIHFSQDQEILPEQKHLQKFESFRRSNRSNSSASSESNKRQLSQKLPSSIRTRDEHSKK